MTGTALTANATATGPLPVRAGAVRVEKVRNASDLGDERLHDRAPRTPHDEAYAARDLSQSETREYAPLWHGPRLRPAFVAQVLGQAMLPREMQDTRSVFAAYEEGAARGPSRRLFERKI